MTINDLKVKRASVFVSNEEAEAKEYGISANFNTTKGVLERVSEGNVIKDGRLYASFNSNHGESTTITFYNEANTDVAIQCEVNKFVRDFLDLAISKVVSEAAE